MFLLCAHKTQSHLNKISTDSVCIAFILFAQAICTKVLSCTNDLDYTPCVILFAFFHRAPEVPKDLFIFRNIFFLCKTCSMFSQAELSWSHTWLSHTEQRGIETRSPKSKSESDIESLFESFRCPCPGLCVRQWSRSRTGSTEPEWKHYRTMVEHEVDILL